MTNSADAPIPLVTTIAPLAATTDAWLVDIWGVMHNGVAPFASAVAACRAFRAAGGLVLLLSNAPRPAAAVAAQLDRIGVAREAYDLIVSSGDASRAAIAALGEAAVLHVGPERDLTLYDGLAVRRGKAAEAVAIVCTGLADDERETAEDYRAALAPLAARAVPMICANPDLTVERGGRIIPCAGAVAQLYEQLGGPVTYAGKPHLPIYDMAFAELAHLKGRAVARDRTLAIGDGVRTDIAGAAAAGIRSLFVASGVHVAGSRLDAATLAKLFPDARSRPVAAMTSLAW